MRRLSLTAWSIASLSFSLSLFLYLSFSVFSPFLPSRQRLQITLLAPEASKRPAKPARIRPTGRMKKFHCASRSAKIIIDIRFPMQSREMEMHCVMKQSPCIFKSAARRVYNGLTTRNVTKAEAAAVAASAAALE
jgi:hypothetical protein